MMPPKEEGVHNGEGSFSFHFRGVTWRVQNAAGKVVVPERVAADRLPDGVYDLVVTATDINGNDGSRRFTVHNRPGWVGS
jgi:hypothetical protein